MIPFFSVQKDNSKFFISLNFFFLPKKYKQFDFRIKICICIVISKHFVHNKYISIKFAEKTAVSNRNEFVWEYFRVSILLQNLLD